MTSSGMSVEERARRVRLLAMDVDGVLTDGVVALGASNGVAIELKAFHVQDGLGIRLARAAGLPIAWVTGRSSQVVSRRAQELGVGAVLQGLRDKGAALERLAGESGLSLEQVAFMGDDINDLPALRICGLALAPADAVSEVREVAHFVTRAAGGRGAVREAVELVLRAQGNLEQAQAAYLADFSGQ